MMQVCETLASLLSFQFSVEAAIASSCNCPGSDKLCKVSESPPPSSCSSGLYTLLYSPSGPQAKVGGGKEDGQLHTAAFREKGLWEAFPGAPVYLSLLE